MHRKSNSLYMQNSLLSSSEVRPIWFSNLTDALAAVNWQKDLNEIDTMASLTTRNLRDDIKSQLHLQAAAHGHSMEQEARLILSAAVSQPPSNESFAWRLQNRFKGLDTSVLQQPERIEVPPAHIQL